MTYSNLAELRSIRNRVLLATAGISDRSLRWMICSSMMKRLWSEVGTQLSEW